MSERGRGDIQEDVGHITPWTIKILKVPFFTILLQILLRNMHLTLPGLKISRRLALA